MRQLEEEIKNIGGHLNAYTSREQTVIMPRLRGSHQGDDLPLVHVALAIMGASWTDPDSIALMVMQTLLGGWNKCAGAGKNMESELAQKITANEMCELSYMAFNTKFSDARLFEAHVVAKPDRLDDLTWTIMHKVGRLIYRVTHEDNRLATIGESLRLVSECFGLGMTTCHTLILEVCAAIDDVLLLKEVAGYASHS
ncbi:hypothetical protein L7F22_007177 [Adiantum nelumboides]|nr:hypothetical protein [Adiantum nelumboides]